MESGQKVKRRSFLKYVGAAVVAIAAGGAGYYLYTTSVAPGKPKENPLAGKTINIVVPYKAGGGYDAQSRILAKYLPKYVEGVTPVVINKPGAEALLGPAEVWNSKPDGLTICLANGRANALATMSPDYGLPFTIFDFMQLGRVTWGAEVLVAAKDGPLKTWEDMKKLGRPIKEVALGKGSESYYPSIVTYTLLGIPYELVLGFKGSGEGIAAVVRGDCDIYCVDEDTARHHVEAGAVIPLLAVSTERLKTFPNIPALGELVPKDKLPIVETLDGIAKLGRNLIAHPDTPKDVYDAWQDALKKVFADEGYAEENAKVRSFKPALGEDMKEIVEKTKEGVEKLKGMLKELGVL
jgi:tripartite-type tricarboxylate transporter receptor subunit TctC